MTRLLEETSAPIYRRILDQPSHSIAFGLVVLIVAVGFFFLVAIYPNDWDLNTNSLPDGLRAYENPAYVYPPWALMLLWPYRLMTARGSRIAAVLAAGWLAYHRRWSLGRFLLIVLNPYFIFTLLLSNVDVLVLVLPIIIWEVTEGTRWQALSRGMALALLLVKPHVGGLVVLYLLWRERAHWRRLILPLGLLAAITLPISLVGRPPLIAQWVENLAHPSASNQDYWAFNNVSLTSLIGALPAVAVIAAALGGLMGLTTVRRRSRTASHSISALFLSALMISPYTSHQSMVAATMLMPSVPAVLMAYVIAVGATLLGVYRPYAAWWTLLLGILALWFYRGNDHKD